MVAPLTKEAASFSSPAVRKQLMDFNNDLFNRVPLDPDAFNGGLLANQAVTPGKTQGFSVDLAAIDGINIQIDQTRIGMACFNTDTTAFHFNRLKAKPEYGVEAERIARSYQVG